MPDFSYLKMRTELDFTKNCHFILQCTLDSLAGFGTIYVCAYVYHMCVM